MISQAQTEVRSTDELLRPGNPSIDEKSLRSWMSDGRFADYRVMLDKLIRFQPHVLTENEERIMRSMAKSVPYRGIRSAR
jgi:oligoendopeptidase F